MSQNRVDFEQLIGVETPEATASHMPIPHHSLVKMTRKALDDAGLTILDEEHGLARGGLRYFGGFALTGKGVDGEDRQVVLGLRNSHDKGFAAAVCIGNRMLVCDNLCFNSDIKLARRHTVNILNDLPRVISNAVGRVVSHWNDMSNRIACYQKTEIVESQVNDLLVSLVDKKALPARNIYKTIQEWRDPRHPEFKGKTLWNLYNAITEHLKGSDHSKLPFRTMTVQSVFDPLAAHVPHLELQEIVTPGCEENAESLDNGEVIDLRD